MCGTIKIPHGEKTIHKRILPKFSFLNRTMNGWFKIERRLLDSDLWLSETFTKGQAWIDLIGITNYRAGYVRVRGIRVDVDRGFVGWSENKLASRWHWSKGKVRRFLSELEKDERIVIQKSNVLGLINLTNYNSIQKNSNTDGNTDEPQTVIQTDTNKKEKKVKNEKKPLSEHEASDVDRAIATALARGIRLSNPAFAQKFPAAEESPLVERWAGDIEKLRRIDKATEEQIMFVIRWLFEGTGKDSDFWRPNIQSASKLREKFQTLVGVIKRERQTSLPKVTFIS